MELQYLDEKNPDYIAQAGVWEECAALYHGGEAFKSLLNKFLPQNPGEPSPVYETRKQESSYSSYLGPIVDYFTAWLFSGSFTVRPKADDDEISTAPEFYAKFENDIGGDVKLVDFMRERMTTALVEGCAHWLVVMNDDGLGPATDKALWEERGLGKATLQKVERKQIYDWDVDEHGKLLWCIIHTTEKVRRNLGSKRNVTREIWKYYDRESVATYHTEYEGNKRPIKTFDVPMVDKRVHGCVEVPLVALHIKDGMWVGDRVRAPQVEHFRLSCANAWLIRRTCYAMPILNLEDASTVPTMGSGYYMAIGVNEKFTWSSPPNTPFDVIAKETAAKRDEIFRIVHQMAQGLDNNAETTGRSAESKGLDVAATRIMLLAYGAMVREAIEETFEIISDARGEADMDWNVEGFSGFDTTSAASLLAMLAEAQLLGIPSATFAYESKVKAALALHPEATSHTKEAMRSEIRDATMGQHGDLDSLNMTAADKMKLQIEAMKSKTALKVQDKKGLTALQIQEAKNANVRLEVSMAGKQPDAVPPDQAHLDEHKVASKGTEAQAGGITKGARNLINEDA